MKYILLQHNTQLSIHSPYDIICGPDKRNLWMYLLIEGIAKVPGYSAVLPEDINRNIIENIVGEIHVNAQKGLTDKPKIALYMETEAVYEANNKENAIGYHAIMSHDPLLLKLDGCIPINLPCFSSTFQTYTDGERKGYIMISGNKSLNAHKCEKDLYVERRKIIKHFTRKKSNKFDLYGNGWNIPELFLEFRTITNLWLKNRLPGTLSCYKGSVDSKYLTLKGYKFNFCYENCVKDNYLTEKLFDAIIAGCIPVYWGSDNDKIPKECYIDASKFPSADTLVRYCETLPEENLSQILAAGQRFLAGPATNFSHEEFSAKILSQVRKIILN